MGRKLKHNTEEEQSYARKLRNQRYYERHKKRLNAESMRKYWERKRNNL